MTTLSVVDVESIVGDMPAQVCEFPDEKCDAQASWILRVHLSDHANQTCRVTVVTMCDTHASKATYLVSTAVTPICLCGVNVLSVFHKERL